jgi:hypothetical protein
MSRCSIISEHPVCFVTRDIGITVSEVHRKQAISKIYLLRPTQPYMENNSEYLV